MIGPRPAKQSELNYAFRRVIYDMMIAAKSLASLSQGTRDYSGKESMKIAALIMAKVDSSATNIELPAATSPNATPASIATRRAVLAAQRLVKTRAKGALQRLRIMGLPQS